MMVVTITETTTKTITETITKTIKTITEMITEMITETIKTSIDPITKTIKTLLKIEERTNRNSSIEGAAMIEEVDKMTVEKEEETNTETKTTTKEIEDPFPDPEAVMGIEMGMTIITNKGVTINHHQKDRLCKYRCKEP